MFQVLFLTLLIYFTIIIWIASIRAFIKMKKSKGHAKRAFKDTFWHFFLELLNPFNWI